jgi:hypothetical protein
LVYNLSSTLKNPSGMYEEPTFVLLRASLRDKER